MTGWLAIVNPRSGGARNRSSFRRVLRLLERVVEEIVFTEQPGHARELASRAGRYRGLAVVGGDGTLHEVLTGTDGGSQRLALVPTGRGNSLARDLGLTSALRGLGAIETDLTTRVDLVDVVLEDDSGRRCALRSASTVAIGYPVAVTARADRSFRMAGSYCYLAAAIVESVRQPRFTIDRAYDGAPAESRGLTGLILNNTRHVANFVGFPDARCDDGRFDVLELDAGFVQQNLHNVSALCGSRHAFSPPPFQARALEARLNEPTSVMIDGQIYAGVTSLRACLIPAALECSRAEHGATA